MIEVQTPDGSIVEFADGTSEQEIVKAMRTMAIKSTAAERVKSMGPFRKALYGAERSLDESAMGLKQIVQGLSPDEKQELAIRREMEDQIPGSSISRIAGDVLQWYAPSSAGLKAVTSIPKLAGAGGRVLAAAGIGGISGAVQPVLEGESRAANATTGALFGAGGQMAGDAAGRAIEGLVSRSKAAGALPKSVQAKMTLGQSVDKKTLPGRIMSSVEERAQSIPFIGDIVRNSREDGLNAWRKNVIDEAAPAGFSPRSNPVRNQIDDISKEFQKRYSAVLDSEQIVPSRQFEADVLKIINNPQSGVPREEARKIGEDIIRNYRSRFGGKPGVQTGTTQVSGKTQPRSVIMSGQQAKDFESFLGAQAHDFDIAGQRGTPGARNLSNLFDQIESAWTNAYYSQVHPTTKKALSELDSKYAKFKIVERAAGARGTAEPGMFTPAQLDEAVSTKVGRTRYARAGGGTMQKQAELGREVFSARIPDSGTAERGMLAAGLGGLITHPVETAVAAGAIPLVTTGAGKNIMMGQTSAQRMAQQIRANLAARSSGLPAGIAISDIMREESERP